MMSRTYCRDILILQRSGQIPTKTTQSASAGRDDFLKHPSTEYKLEEAGSSRQSASSTSIIFPALELTFERSMIDGTQFLSLSRVDNVTPSGVLRRGFAHILPLLLFFLLIEEVHPLSNSCGRKSTKAGQDS